MPPAPRRTACGVAWLALVAVTLAGTAPGLAIVGEAGAPGALAGAMVMVLQRAGRVAGFCSGIVVAKDAVLTAAHCVPPGAAVTIHYRDGTTPVLLDVAAVVRHPGYRPDAVRRRERSIDLALVRLANPLPARFGVAALADAQPPTAPGAPFALAGFGLGREGDATTSGTLRLAAVAARAPLSGVLLWAEDPTGAGRGACTGDSGGAVVAPGRDTVVAVIAWSAGTGARQCGALTQAVWVAPQRGWILGVLAGWR